MDIYKPLASDATPIQIAGAAIGQLNEIWDDIASVTGDGHGRFIEEIFGGIWHDNDKGETFEEELNQWHNQPEEVQPLVILQFIFITAAYACQAMKSQKNDEAENANGYARQCLYWLGVTTGAWGARKGLDDPRKVFAKMGANARHAETRAMKNDVFDWLDKNMGNFSSMDRAAEAVTKQQPVAFRTARDWVGHWKKMRSAGKT